MKLLVVILNYRVTEFTIDCLRSLSGEIARIPDAKVAVCENGTGAEAAQQLRQAIEENGWGSWVDLTVIYPNRGFTGGNNIVIRAALESPDPPEYVLLLNADTIVQEHALETLVEFMDGHPKAGIAASEFLGPDGTVRPSPFRFMGIATELDRGLRLGLTAKVLPPCVVAPPPTEACRADWVGGASIILRRTMLEQIGLLDEGLYTYFDDIDICWRAKRAGWETWHVPASKVIHFEGSSTGLHAPASRRPVYWYQARRRFFLKSYGGLYTALADAAFIFGYALYRLRRPIQGKPDTDPTHLLADSIRHSVFLTGFKVKDVENPALCAEAATPAALVDSAQGAARGA